jgi:hypothetical protein
VAFLKVDGVEYVLRGDLTLHEAGMPGSAVPSFIEAPQPEIDVPQLPELEAESLTITYLCGHRVYLVGHAEEGMRLDVRLNGDCEDCRSWGGPFIAIGGAPRAKRGDRRP